MKCNLHQADDVKDVAAIQAAIIVHFVVDCVIDFDVVEFVGVSVVALTFASLEYFQIHFQRPLDLLASVVVASMNLGYFREC